MRGVWRRCTRSSGSWLGFAAFSRGGANSGNFLVGLAHLLKRPGISPHVGMMLPRFHSVSALDLFEGCVFVDI